jgi:hypothetical protein
MSPTIRSKGGQPLFIGGMVAGADKCCDCGSLCPGPLLVTARFAEGAGLNDGDPNAWCQALHLPYYYPAYLYGPVATNDGEVRYLGRFNADEKSGADVSVVQVEFFIPRTPREGSKARLEIRPGITSWNATYEADYISCPNCKCANQFMYVFKPSDLIGGSSSFCGGNVEFVVTGSCWRDCEDFCAYKMGVTQPANISLGGVFQDLCENLFYTYQENKVPYALEASLPSGTTIDSDIAKSFSQSISYGGVSSLLTIVRHFIAGTTPNTSAECLPDSLYYQENPPFVASCGIGAEVFCTNGRTPNPFSLRLSVSVNVNVGFSDEKRNECGGVYSFGKTAFFELESLCQTDSKRHCYPITTPYRILDTPVEFSATAFTTSLGAYDDDQYESRGAGNLNGIAASIGDALKDALAATFRITSRPNCRPPVACDCSHVDLRGLIIDFAGRSFEIGKYVDEEVDGVRFVSGQNPSGYTVIRQTRAGGFPQDTTQIDLICAESGGWMVLMSTRCQPRVNGELVSDTIDQWAGVMQCSESCDGFYEAASEPGLFQVRTAGEPIPLGEAQDVEYLGRESSAVECEPPARPTFSIRQVEFC